MFEGWRGSGWRMESCCELCLILLRFSISRPFLFFSYSWLHLSRVVPAPAQADQSLLQSQRDLPALLWFVRAFQERSHRIKE